MELTLYGYHYSVYVRIARWVMLEKHLTWTHVEINPFGPLPSTYLEINPFGRVPTLRHDGFVVYETSAITRYLDEAFTGPSLQPRDPRQIARMSQIIAIADSYAYWPLVRQVYAQRVFRSALGERPDEIEIAKGLDTSKTVLMALENLAGDTWLCGDGLSLADFHLGSMIACFTAAPEGAHTLAKYPKLQSWWDVMRKRRSFGMTDPGLPKTP